MNNSIFNETKCIGGIRISACDWGRWDNGGQFFETAWTRSPRHRFYCESKLRLQNDDDVGGGGGGGGLGQYQLVGKRQRPRRGHSPTHEETRRYIGSNGNVFANDESESGLKKCIGDACRAVARGIRKRFTRKGARKGGRKRRKTRRRRRRRTKRRRRRTKRRRQRTKRRRRRTKMRGGFTFSRKYEHEMLPTDSFGGHTAQKIFDIQEAVATEGSEDGGGGGGREITEGEVRILNDFWLAVRPRVWVVDEAIQNIFPLLTLRPEAAAHQFGGRRKRRRSRKRRS